jgi:hypothetical protein
MTEIPGTNISDDNIPSVRATYGDPESLAHLASSNSGVEYGTFAMWRRPPRVFRKPAPPSPSTIVPSSWPAGVVGYELDGTFTLASAVLEAAVDNYYEASWFDPDTAPPDESYTFTPDGGDWVEKLIVDNASAVWASSSVFSYYDPGPGGQSGGGTEAASWPGSLIHGSQDTSEHDVTAHLDVNGNLCVYLTAAVTEAPTVSPPTFPTPGGDFALWWGGSLSQPFTRLRYTYAAPSYRWVYDVAPTVPPLRHLTRRDGLNSTAGRVTGGRSQQGTNRRVSGHW